MLQTQINDEDRGIKTLTLSGSLDTMAAPQLESEGMSLISKGCRALVIDVSGLEFISSAGLRAIFTIVKKAMPLGGKLVISGAAGMVKNALTMSGFDSFIPLKDTRAEAVATCSSTD
jgi:anti-anti-sigma factor